MLTAKWLIKKTNFVYRQRRILPHVVKCVIYECSLHFKHLVSPGIFQSCILASYTLKYKHEKSLQTVPSTPPKHGIKQAEEITGPISAHLTFSNVTLIRQKTCWKKQHAYKKWHWKVQQILSLLLNVQTSLCFSVHGNHTSKKTETYPSRYQEIHRGTLIQFLPTIQ